MAKIVKVKAKVKTCAQCEELRQSLRDRERDYDTLLMDYEDLNRDYEMQTQTIVDLETKIAALKSQLEQEERLHSLAKVGIELWQDMHSQVSHEKAVETGRAARAERLLEMIGAWTPIELAMYFGDNKPLAIAIEEQKIKLFPFEKPRNLTVMEGELQ